MPWTALKFLRIIFALLVVSITLVADTTAQQPEETKADFGNFEAPLPGIQEDNISTFVDQSGPSTLATYVNIVVNFVTALIVILGVISIVIGGYMYMTAGGNATQVENAKTWIFSALLGILLAFIAWLILNTISPQFTTDVQDPSLPGAQSQ